MDECKPLALGRVASRMRGTAPVLSAPPPAGFAGPAAAAATASAAPSLGSKLEKSHSMKVGAYTRPLCSST